MGHPSSNVDRGNDHRGVGTGIGIGIGVIGVIRDATSAPSQTVPAKKSRRSGSVSTPKGKKIKRAAKKGDDSGGGNAPKNPGTKTKDNPPANTPAPPGTSTPIENTGGATLHLATGDNPNLHRPGIMAWVTKAGKKALVSNLRHFSFIRRRCTCSMQTARKPISTPNRLPSAATTSTQGALRRKNDLVIGKAMTIRKKIRLMKKYPYPARLPPMENRFEGGPYRGPGSQSLEGAPIPGVSGAVGVGDAPDLGGPPLSFEIWKKHEQHRAPGGGKPQTWPPSTTRQQPADSGPTL